MANERRHGLIDLDKTLQRLEKEIWWSESQKSAIRLFLYKSKKVDAVEVVHGRWIEKVDMVESYLADCTEVFYECSVCECANIGESPYCPNCGAKMDGGEDNGRK